MNTQTVHNIKYALDDHRRRHKALQAKFFIAHSLSTDIDKNTNSMNKQIFLIMKYDLKGHIKPLLGYGEIA